MPIEIPRYEKRTTGRGGPVPGVRVQADLQEAQALSGVAQSAGQFSKVGQQIAAFGEQVREEQEKAASMEAYVKLNGGMARLLDDPETGYINAKGKEALKRRDGVLGAFDKEVEAITKGLGTDRMKANFQQMVDQQRNDFQKSVDRHASQESNALYKARFSAALTGTQAKSFARVSRGEDLISPESDIRKDMTTGTTLIEGEGLRNGTDPLEIAKQRRAFTTKAHIDILDDLLNRGEAGQAKAYLDTYRDPEVIDEKALADAQIEARINAHSEEDAELNMAVGMYKSSQGDMGTFTAELEGKRNRGEISASSYDAVLSRGLGMRKVEDQFIDARDAPVLNELVAELADNKMFLDSDPRLLELSRGGFRAAMEKRAAYRRGLRTYAIDGLRLQEALERAEVAAYNTRPPFVGPDSQMNTDVSKAMPRSRQFVIDGVQAGQNGLKVEHREDRGAARDDFTKMMNEQRGSIQQRLWDKIMIRANGWYTERKAEESVTKKPGTPPTRKEVREQIGLWWMIEDEGLIWDDLVIDTEIEALKSEREAGTNRPVRSGINPATGLPEVRIYDLKTDTWIRFEN